MAGISRNEVFTTVDLILLHRANSSCQGRIKLYELMSSFRDTPA